MSLKVYSCTSIAVALLCLCAASHLSLAQVHPKALKSIQLLEQEKALRTPAERKLDSRLLQAAREMRGRKMVEGADIEPAKLPADKNGNFEVDISAEVSDQLLSQIIAAGGKIIFSSRQFHSVKAEVNVTIAEKIAGFSAVKFVQPAAVPVREDRSITGHKKNSVKNTSSLSSRLPFKDRAKRVQQQVRNYLDQKSAAATVFAGAVNSQGDRAHRADDVRNLYGYAGQGIRIGVLSDSYNALGVAAADIAAGDLPGQANPFGDTIPVTVLQESLSGIDEGRAMLQIIHDLAPKAQLFFATANGGAANFATNILALRDTPYKCDIIIDDIIYSNEPVFYDGIIAQAVNVVTASGALYFSSAGNAGSLAKNTSGVYEGDFNDSGSPVFTGSTKTGTIHNFGTIAAPEGGDSIISAGSWYNLQWADRPGASGNDYDLFLVSRTGVIKAFSTNIQNGSQNPFEEIRPVPALVAGDHLVVFKNSNAARLAFHVMNLRGRLKTGTIGQTYGHSAAAAAYSVAATPAGAPFTTPVGGIAPPPGPFPGAFTPANRVESFSSDGPRRIFFTADSTPVTPGNYLFGTNGGTVRNKPDITAADGVSTTLLSTSGLNPFYGTSAAAPHAGAIAALLKSAKPTLSPDEMRTLLTTTTADIETPGYDYVSGWGIVQAYQAMQQLNPAPQANLILDTVISSEGTFSNNNGRIEPGELANVHIQLNNPSLGNATGVNATLSTSTPGVSIIQGSVNFGDIKAGDSAATSTPFVIAVNSSVPCGTTIHLTLTINLSGGISPKVFPISITIGFQPFKNGITSILGATPPSGSGYTVVSGQQSGRINRFTMSTCAVPVANPGLFIATGLRQFDAYTFTNSTPASQCVTVSMTSTNGQNLYAAAYNDSGFVPANPSFHYLAEPGPSSAAQTFSFTVGAGKAFTVVVHDVNVLPASNSPYRLSLSLANCATGPSCTPVEISTDSIVQGATGLPYSQAFAATGGSESYNFYLSGSLPPGLSLKGNVLSGTPTQAGRFPIQVIATDLTGCPADTNNYILVVTGITPASITTITGTPQQVLPLSPLPVPLSVIVRDSANRPLGGVNVIFSAPLRGAGGTFDGGVKQVTVVTDSGGVATAPTFTANDTVGTYIVGAGVAGTFSTVSAVFNLTNFCPANFIVTSNGDSGPGTLRDIVRSACRGTRVTFDSTVTSIVLTTGEIVISKAVTISGPGASRLSISGNNNSRIFNISADSSAVSISGLTLRNGRPSGGSAGGGAILINNGVYAGELMRIVVSFGQF